LKTIIYPKASNPCLYPYEKDSILVRFKTIANETILSAAHHLWQSLVK